jgi:hypothetical protein
MNAKTRGEGEEFWKARGLGPAPNSWNHVLPQVNNVEGCASASLVNSTHLVKETNSGRHESLITEISCFQQPLLLSSNVSWVVCDDS